MEIIAIILSRTVLLALAAVQLAMLVRALMSLFGFDEESVLGTFLMLLTEPVILPARLLLSRIRALEGLPIDLSFLTTYLLLSLLTYSLPIIG